MKVESVVTEREFTITLTEEEANELCNLLCADPAEKICYIRSENFSVYSIGAYLKQALGRPMGLGA